MDDNTTTPTSPLSPLALFPPLPPQQHKGSAPEFYGFTAWISTYIAFIVYLLWALFPDSWIEACGITWYPNREWGILIPAWTIVTVLLTYFTYFALALYNTPPLDDLSTITDARAMVITGPESQKHYMEFAKPQTIPDLYDMPLGLVNKVLYSRKRSRT